MLASIAMMHAFAQQPKFDLADVHVSTTPRWFIGDYEQNGGGTTEATARTYAADARGLLADQFELKTHTENRNVRVYAVIVPGKPKMSQAEPFPNMGTMVNCHERHDG